jgi:predicted ABC-type ATPase
MREVIIMSGASGSGKSTWAKRRSEQSRLRNAIVSADDYFTVDGVYRFDASRLGEAHANCFRQFMACLQDHDCGLVIVDNTNTTTTEIAPYMLAAEAFGWAPRIVTVRAVGLDAAALARRNTHGVPERTIALQLGRIAAREFPRHWYASVVEV